MVVVDYMDEFNYLYETIGAEGTDVVLDFMYVFGMLIELNEAIAT